jgi:hypothetical protein
MVKVRPGRKCVIVVQDMSKALDARRPGILLKAMFVLDEGERREYCKRSRPQSFGCALGTAFTA